MKKTAIALTLIMALLISYFFIPLVAEAQAPEPPNVDTLGPVVFCGESANVIILSPKNSTYNVNPIQLHFTVEANGMFGQFGNVGVSLDGGVINSVTDFTKSVVQSGPDWYWYRITALASVMLPTLSEGTHSVTVYYGWQYLGARPRYEVYGHTTVDFIVVTVNPSPLSSLPSTPDSNLPKITVHLPEDNKTYSINNVPYSITVEKPSSWFDYGGYNGQLFSVIYYLDDSPKVTIAEKEFDSLESLNSKDPIALQGTLTGLSDGNHTFQVFVYGVSYYQDPHQMQGIPSYNYVNNNCTVYFTVDATPPSVSVLSLENKTYTVSDLPLNFTVNELFSKISYVLDGLENVTIDGNTTLTQLANGDHNLTIYAEDEAGNVGASETMYFSVDVPFPTTLVITASGTSLAVVVAGFLVYFKKRKRGAVQG